MLFIGHKTGEKKRKSVRISVEWVKESNAHFIAGDSASAGLDLGKPHWDKCKLVLVKATGGYMLEFFSPPKVLKLISLTHL